MQKVSDPVVFDGKKFAREIEESLPKVKARLVSIYDANNPGAVKYTEIKEKKASELGIEFEKIQISNDKSQVKTKIQILNKDKSVNGIMIQMPFPNAKFLIDLIDPRKDVDGLREDSPYLPAVVRAVCEILNSKYEIPNKFKIKNPKIVVVGSKGMVGKRLIKVLDVRYSVSGMDKDDFSVERLKQADVIISATGQADLIKGNMVKNGFVAIDLGYPKAEFTPSALLRASFYTPVPGGVGPVTVAMLFKNLVELGYGI